MEGTSLRKLKQKYDKKLSRLESSIESYKNSGNAELKTAVSTLQKEKEEVELLLEAINNQIKSRTITISRNEYESLLADSRKLSALEGAGVDNWSGYGDAMEMLEQEEAEDEI